jgi:phosphoribosylformimino-5-aminoimidazole carboxamide ribotide isomerase
MLILPAIDLRDGKVVRLAKGDYDRQTTYSDDPAAVARTFAQAGAKWIHVVDLDAAKSGTHGNLAAVAAIRQAVDSMTDLSSSAGNIELGGGARDDRSVQAMLAGGATRVIIGSAALGDWPWFESLLGRPALAGKIVLGLDARGGKLAAKGWLDQTNVSAVEVAGRAKSSGLAGIVYTDIDRDGMLQGPNLQATAEMIAATDVPIIASGGISSIDDLVQCAAIGCWGAIVGRAYYEGKVDIAQAIAAVQ